MESPQTQQLQLLHAEALKPEWVETSVRLKELVPVWRGFSVVGLDTEFQRTDTFFPKAGLIQIFAGSRCYLLDPLAIQDLEPFKEFLEDANVIKVLHACSEDLEVFDSLVNAIPQPLFDTQVAEAAKGTGLSVGYQKLLENCIDLSIAKEETRSDWLQRPLTESQRHYAALDVVFLPLIYELQTRELKEKGRYEWVLEDCQKKIDAANERDLTGQALYHKSNHAWRYSPQQRAMFRELLSWREIKARDRDVPRNRVLDNSVINEIVLRQPDTGAAVARFVRGRYKPAMEDMEQASEIIQRCLALSDDECPPPVAKPLDNKEKRQLRALRSEIDLLAKELGIPPELLARKRDFERLIRSRESTGRYQLPESCLGWREALYGQRLLEAIQAVE